MKPGSHKHSTTPKKIKVCPPWSALPLWCFSLNANPSFKIDFKIPLQECVYSKKTRKRNQPSLNKSDIPQSLVHGLNPCENTKSQHQVEVKRKPQLCWLEMLRTRSKDIFKKKVPAKQSKTKQNNNAHCQRAWPSPHPTLLGLHSPKRMRGWSHGSHAEQGVGLFSPVSPPCLLTHLLTWPAPANIS